MNQEIKAKWLTELRSGKYKQTTGRLLSHSNGYCCLGVLAKSADQTDESILEICTLEDLDPEIVDLIDLSYEIQVKLASMNDIERKSFEEIADYIEKEL